MANANSTTPPSQPSSDASSSEWALVAGAHLDAALGELRQAIEKAPRLELRVGLCVALVEVAKLAGVLEWLGEELVVFAQGGAQ